MKSAWCLRGRVRRPFLVTVQAASLKVLSPSNVVALVESRCRFAFRTSQTPRGCLETRTCLLRNVLRASLPLGVSETLPADLTAPLGPGAGLDRLRAELCNSENPVTLYRPCPENELSVEKTCCDSAGLCLREHGGRELQHTADSKAAPGRCVKLDLIHLPEYGPEGDTQEKLGVCPGCAGTSEPQPVDPVTSFSKTSSKTCCCSVRPSPRATHSGAENAT